MTFKIPPTGTVPQFGDCLHARFTFVVSVGGGWTVKVHANGEDQAKEVAERNGYSVVSVRREEAS